MACPLFYDTVSRHLWASEDADADSAARRHDRGPLRVSSRPLPRDASGGRASTGRPHAGWLLRTAEVRGNWSTRTDTTRELGIIVLAAGASRRMGTQKLLLPLGGEPVLARVVGAAEATSAARVVVVLGHAAAQVRAALPAGRWEAVENAEHTSGLASSLRVGLTALEQHTPGVGSVELTGAVVLLGDQPLVTASMIEQVLARARALPQRIVAASYSGEPRHPVHFPRSCFGALCAIRGDEGGRSLLMSHGDQVELVALEPRAAALDVDTPEDYARVVAYWNTQHSSEAG